MSSGPVGAGPMGARPGFASAGAPYAASAYGLGKLTRPQFPRMIAGVCSGFALQYGWDVTLVRVITAVAALLTSGFVGLAYLAAWVIIPEAAYALPPEVTTYPPPGNASFSSAPPPPPPSSSAGGSAV